MQKTSSTSSERLMYVQFTSCAYGVISEYFVYFESFWLFYFLFRLLIWSSLICKTSARHSRHKCDTNDTNATQVKNFDFHNDMRENTLSHPCISYVANATLQGEGKFNSKNYFLEMLCFHAKILSKSAPQKLYL